MFFQIIPYEMITLLILVLIEVWEGKQGPCHEVSKWISPYAWQVHLELLCRRFQGRALPGPIVQTKNQEWFFVHFRTQDK